MATQQPPQSTASSDPPGKGALALRRGQIKRRHFYVAKDAIARPLKAKKSNPTGACSREGENDSQDSIAVQVLESIRLSLVVGLSIALKGTGVYFADILYICPEQSTECPGEGPQDVMTAAFLVGEEAPVSELAVDLELTNTAGLLVVPLGANRYAVKAVGGFSASWGAHWQEIGPNEDHYVTIPLRTIWPEATLDSDVTLKLKRFGD